MIFCMAPTSDPSGIPVRNLRRQTPQSKQTVTGSRDAFDIRLITTQKNQINKFMCERLDVSATRSEVYATRSDQRLTHRDNAAANIDVLMRTDVRKHQYKAD